MIILIRVLVITYIIAINVYGFILMLLQKRQKEESKTSTIKDAKLFATAMLGGAIGIYASMFILSYRLQSMFLMIVIPIIIVLNIYIVYRGFANNFGMVISTTI